MVMSWTEVTDKGRLSLKRLRRLLKFKFLRVLLCFKIVAASYVQKHIKTTTNNSTEKKNLRIYAKVRNMIGVQTRF